MNAYNQRYLFIDYQDLDKINIRRLKSLCDRVYILVQEEEKYVPLDKVMAFQRFGKRIKWVVVDAHDEEDMIYRQCFLLGEMHQKLRENIEFVIISSDEALDPIVAYLKKEGRKCQRLMRRKMEMEEEDSTTIHVTTDEPIISFEDEVYEEIRLGSTSGNTSNHDSDDFGSYNTGEGDFILDTKLLEKTVSDTRRRLEQSGNRPSNIELLRHYIIINNEELVNNENVDQIIEQLEIQKVIQRQGRELSYPSLN